MAGVPGAAGVCAYVRGLRLALDTGQCGGKNSARGIAAWDAMNECRSVAGAWYLAVALALTGWGRGRRMVASRFAP